MGFIAPSGGSRRDLTKCCASRRPIGFLLGFLCLGGLFAGCDLAGLSSSPVPPVSPAQLAEFVNGHEVAVVKFGATWCGPCRSVDTELDRLAPNLPKGVAILKVDVDNSSELAEQFEIGSIPHLALFRGGKQVNSTVGYMSATELLEWMETGQPSPIHDNPFVNQ